MSVYILNNVVTYCGLIYLYKYHLSLNFSLDISYTLDIIHLITFNT